MAGSGNAQGAGSLKSRIRVMNLDHRQFQNTVAFKITHTRDESENLPAFDAHDL